MINIKAFESYVICMAAVGLLYIIILFETFYKKKKKLRYSSKFDILKKRYNNTFI